MPSAEWLRANEADANTPETRPTPGRDARTSRVVRDTDAAGSFFMGLADTVTFGFLDEAGGFVDTLGGTDGRSNVWNSDKSFSDLWSENIAANREVMEGVEEAHGTSFLAGQITGGLVPFGSKIGAGTGVGRMVAEGAAYGGLYGVGSSEGDLGDRLIGGLNGAATGAAGGYVFGAMLLPAASKLGRLVFKRGAPVKLGEEALSTLGPKAADDLPSITPKPTVRDPAGLDTSVKMGAPAASVSDELPEGALLTARELLGEPGAARAALTKRIGKLTPQEAQKFFNDLEAADAAGTQIDNPHYRSLLQIDLSGTKLETDEVLRINELFEEATEALAEKAGMASRTVKGMEAEVTKELKKGVTLGDLEDAYDAGKRGFVQVRIAQNTMLTAGAKIVRLRTEVLPKVLRGETSREELAEELTDVAHRFVLAKGIVSNAGRSLGILAHGTKARMVEVADDVFELEGIDAVRTRVTAALAEMGDTELGEMLNKVRTMSDADKIADILLNPAEAKAFTTWQRSLNTVSLFLRSNALSPATGLFNTVGFVLNDFFRNDLAKGWAARGMTRAGDLDAGLALRLERQIGRSVYWTAQKQGLQALLKRLKWEAWSDVERIAGVGWGSGRVAETAKNARTAMLADGFVPPELREFKERVRLNVPDTAAFNSRIEAEQGDTALATIIYHAERARAVAANTVDALGSASMKLFTGAIDDFGREFVTVKETYAQAARFAFREAVEAGVSRDALGDYVTRRAHELAELPPSELLERVEAALLTGEKLNGEAAFLTEVHKLVHEEADTVLAMDGPQSALGKASDNLAARLHPAVTAVFLPFVRTPIRLFEQGVVNYGPLAATSREVQDILRKGAMPTATADDKLAAALEQARVEIGTTVFQAGLVMGLLGGITATNGGFESSANLDAGPPSRLNLPGGGFVEIGRIDPFSFTAGMGAIIGQAFREGFADGTEYDQMEALRTGLATAYLGARDSLLGKTYLQGLQELTDALTANSVDSSMAGLGKALQSAAARFVIPAAGTGRMVNDTFRPSAIEAVGFTDTLLRHIPGAGWGMAARIDPLGDEIKGRAGGVNFGNSELTEGAPISDVKRQLRDLGINITTMRKADPVGFELTSEELSEVRRIRGKEAVDASGLTMEEALGDLLADPWFQSLPTKAQKQEEVVRTMREFNKPAWELLAERNPGFASKREYTRSLADYMHEGMSRREAQAGALEDVEAQGLPSPVM
jgi:hypothetical protein